MNMQYIHLLRILLDPHITIKPMSIMREMQKRGKGRMQNLTRNGRLDKKRAFSFFRTWLDGEILSRHNGRWVLNSFVPPFPGPAYDRLFENMLSGRRLSPVSAFIAVTAECPYNCWHCSLKQRKTGNLSTRQWLDVIGQLHNLGASIISFTGGEPLVRDDLPDLVRAVCEGGAASIVFSSGACTTPAKISALKAAGLWAFCVSLDHPDPSVCDSLRGTQGAYERACHSLELSRKAGLYTMIGSVGTRSIIDGGHLPRLYTLARKLKVDELRIVEPMPCGKLSKADKNTLLTPAHLRKIRQFHVETNHKGRLPKVCAFNQIESPEIFGCGGGTQHLFIDSAGEMCPCDFTPMSFGNVTRESVEAVWNRMSTAMVQPRRHCFIQKHYKTINKYANGSFPLTPEQSLAVCRETGTEPMPDYFAMVTGSSEIHV
jgi:MoaA/NifB/PqqE/SkfB family radical SAM enzyme